MRLALAILFFSLVARAADTNTPATMGRFAGWYQSGSGPALEAGYSVGEGWVETYDRTAKVYRPLNLVGNGLTLRLSQFTAFLNGGYLTLGSTTHEALDPIDIVSPGNAGWGPGIRLQDTGPGAFPQNVGGIWWKATSGGRVSSTNALTIQAGLTDRKTAGEIRFAQGSDHGTDALTISAAPDGQAGAVTICGGVLLIGTNRLTVVDGKLTLNGRALAREP